MSITDEIIEDMGEGWLPVLYADNVRSQRTRGYSLDIPERENHAEILHTLLGIEVKVGRKRFACPDLATARYMQVFAKIGCREFAVPYDITQISGIADELETSWQRVLLLVEAKSPDRNAARLRSKTIKIIRLALHEIGPGERMPEFNQSTKQRGA